MKTPRFWVAGLSWAFAILLECGALGLVHVNSRPDGPTLATFAGLHGLSVLLVMWAVSEGRGEPFQRAAVEGFLTFWVPLLGAACSGLILLIGALPKAFGLATEEELRRNHPAGGLIGALAKDQVLRMLETGPPGMTIGEVMRCRDLERVEEALVHLAHGNRAEDIDALKTLLNHAEPEIRVRAHLLLVEMQDRVIGILAKAGEEAREGGGAEPMKRAGRACLVLSRIAHDAETFTVFARESVDWLLQAHRQDPTDSEMLLELGQANLLAGSINAARLYLHDFIKRHPQDLRGYLAHAECSFRLGDREALKVDCEAILAGAPASSPERATAEFLIDRVGGAGA